MPVAIDAAVFGFCALNLLKGFGLVGRIDYAKLESELSFAREAGEFAVAGEVPTRSRDGRYEVATFAGGCFWGTELRFQRLPGVVSTCVGYTQGKVTQPSYEQVCSGTTGHTEGIQLTFDSSVVKYESLCEVLLSSVDPTALNRVGNDRGTQYRHGIYPHSDEQLEVARRCIEREQSKRDARVVTEVKRAEVFWPAENYHRALPLAP